jgi:nucleotide-binding universal stress UspA family protein
MTQGRAILAGCAELLSQIGIPDVQQLQKHGALDIILADLKDIRLMILGRRGTQNPVGSNLESIIRLQKKPVLIVPETFTPLQKPCLRLMAARKAGETCVVLRSVPCC